MRLVRYVIISVIGLNLGSGCVAYQIRDELKKTNSELQRIDQRLDTMSADMDKINVSVTDSDHILNRSNRSLSSIESSMEPIRVSLQRIDDELMGFREMADKIAHYVPVNIKPSTPPPPKEAPTTETTPAKK